MSLTPETEVFLSKAIDTFLHARTIHKLKFDRSDCLDCFSQLSNRLHELVGDRMQLLQVEIDFTRLNESDL